MEPYPAWYTNGYHTSFLSLSHRQHISLISLPRGRRISLTSHLFHSLSNRTSSLLFVTRKYLPNFLWTGSLYQDPFGPLVSGSCSSTCARSLSEDLCMRTLSEHLYQDFCARPLSQDPCVKTLVDHLYQDPVGPLVPGSCRTTCARSLYQDPNLYQDPFEFRSTCIRVLSDHLCNISVSGSWILFRLL